VPASPTGPKNAARSGRFFDKPDRFGPKSEKPGYLIGAARARVRQVMVVRNLPIPAPIFGTSDSAAGFSAANSADHDQHFSRSPGGFSRVVPNQYSLGQTLLSLISNADVVLSTQKPSQPEDRGTPPLLRPWSTSSLALGKSWCTERAPEFNRWKQCCWIESNGRRRWQHRG
jgi:hypothetical protein